MRQSCPVRAVSACGAELSNSKRSLFFETLQPEDYELAVTVDQVANGLGLKTSPDLAEVLMYRLVLSKSQFNSDLLGGGVCVQQNHNTTRNTTQATRYANSPLISKVLLSP